MLTRLNAIHVEKPWGRTDVPTRFGGETGRRLGEVWFQRPGNASTDALLVKYLFTSELLSVQVHPDDRIAQAKGEKRGKDEAWLVLDAEPGARIGIGLKEPLGPDELRRAAEDGSIAEHLDWRDAAAGDAYYSPAGTIHSIGAGLTLLEVQQNSDITYRLYDFGRPRELHLDDAVASARTELAVEKSPERVIARGRSVVAEGPKFTIEGRTEAALTVPAGEDRPVWLIPLRGTATAGGEILDPSSVWIAEDRLDLRIHAGGELLLAYEGNQLLEEA